MLFISQRALKTLRLQNRLFYFTYGTVVGNGYVPLFCWVYMIKKVLVALLVTVFFLICSYLNFIEASIEQDLSSIDGRRHSSDQFLSILNIVHNHKPQYTLTKIGDLVTSAYLEVKKQLPDVSMYEVATDIKELVISTNTDDTLEFLIGLYLVSKKMGY